jgi:hypothetical protein
MILRFDIDFGVHFGPIPLQFNQSNALPVTENRCSPVNSIQDRDCRRRQRLSLLHLFLHLIGGCVFDPAVRQILAQIMPASSSSAGG